MIVGNSISSSASPSELVDNPFEPKTEADELQPMLDEVQEEKKKTIQKETIQTGSVRILLYHFSFKIYGCIRIG